MSDNIKKSALKQAEESYVGFIKFGKYLTLGSILFFLAVAKCNFGDDGTGGTGNPDLYPEYLERMGIEQ